MSATLLCKRAKMRVSDLMMVIDFNALCIKQPYHVNKHLMRIALEMERARNERREKEESRKQSS